MVDVSPNMFDLAEDVEIGVPTGYAEEIDSVSVNPLGLFCQESGCHEELHYAGRGRKPTKCDAHKAGKSSSKRDKAPSGSAPRGINKIKDDVREAAFAIGILVSPYDQYDGAVVVGSAEKLADTVGLLSARYPRFRMYMETGGEGMLWFKVAATVAAIGIPIAAHHRIIPMDERVAYKRFVDPTVTID